MKIKIPMQSTSVETFEANAVGQVTLTEEAIQVTYQCKKKQIIDSELYGKMSVEIDMDSITCISREKIISIHFEWKEDEALYAVLVAAPEDNYFNFYFQQRSQALKLFDILTNWRNYPLRPLWTSLAKHFA